MSLSEDALVAVCLCTRLGRAESVPALDVREWTGLVRTLQEAGATPRALLAAHDVAVDIRADTALATRLEELLRGMGSVGMEVERLESTGIWILTRGDEQYPRRWKRKLGPSAPVVVFGAGPRTFGDAVAIVGSRDVDEPGRRFACEVAELCARDGWSVVSGGARGVDEASIAAALDAGGCAVEVLADSLERAVAKKAKREAILDGRLTVLTPYLPRDSFTAGKAMGRNRLVYALARYACVVASDKGRGGTWSGATEAMKKALAPVFVRSGDDVPEGNRALIAEGAYPLRGIGDSIVETFAMDDQPSVREGTQAEFEF